MLGELFRLAAEQSPRLTACVNDYMHHSTFANGIQLATQRRYKDDKLRFHILIPGGSFADPDGKSGLMHYLEHALYRIGDAQGFNDRKGELNAETGCDEMAIHGHLENTAENIQFLIQRMAAILSTRIDEHSAATEQKRILNEAGTEQDTADNIHDKLIEQVLGKNVYNASIIGTKKSVSGITAEDLNGIKDSYLVGSNIYIGVTGIANHSRFHKRLVAQLAHVPAGHRPSATLQPFSSGGERREDNSFVQQLYFGLYFPLRPLNEREQALAHASRVYIGNQVRARMQEELGIVYHVQADSYCDETRNGYFGVKGSTLPEDAGQIVPQVSSILSTAANFIDPDDLKIALQEIRDEFSEYKFPLFASHSARSMTENMAKHGRLITLHEQQCLYDTITPETVRSFLSEMLATRPALIAYGDSKELHGCKEFMTMIGQGKRPQNAPAVDHVPD